MFFYGPAYTDYQEYSLDEATSILQHPKFIHKQTTLFMPGYKTKRFTPSTSLLASSYSKRNSTNFLNINWEALNQGSYISAQQNLLKLAPLVADFIIKLFMSGLDEDSLSLCGTSMGGRGIAVIARDVIERSNRTMKIYRITPLDPSNEEAHDEFILPPIEESFAKFVDVIYSDAGGVGTRKVFGHARFWPNNGISPQPGCPDKNIKKLCDHRKATAYWAESLVNGGSKSLQAFPSGCYDNLLQNGVNHYKDSAVLMGIDCPPSARGDYYLEFSTSLGDFYALL